MPEPTETVAEWDGTGPPPAPVGDPGSPLPLDHEPVPAFVLGVHHGWHAIEADSMRPGCANHAWSVCGEVVRPHLDEDGTAPLPWNPASYPASFDPCPACRWIVAARTGTLDAEVAAIRDPLVRRIAEAILRKADEDGRDRDSGHTMQLLTAAVRHAPAGLVAEECSDGDCEHDGDCPSESACRACSLQAGSWAGEWEGQFMAECWIPAPCAPLLALAAHFGVEVPHAD